MSRLAQFYDLRQKQPSCQTCHSSSRTPINNQFVCAGQGADPKLYMNQSGGGTTCENKLTPPVGVVAPKHAPATYPTLQSGGIRPTCYSQACPSIKTTANPCFIKSRHYVQPWTERPSYYLDLTQPFVGGRPVRQAHNVNAIPRTMRFDTANLVGRDFHCQQPCWGHKCV